MAVTRSQAQKDVISDTVQRKTPYNGSLALMVVIHSQTHKMSSLIPYEGRPQMMDLQSQRRLKGLDQVMYGKQNITLMMTCF